MITALNATTAGVYLWLTCMLYIKGSRLFRTDFAAFYTGWTMVREGMGDRIYDYGLQIQYQHKIFVNFGLEDPLLAFYYPPHVALLFSPLSSLSFNAAYVIWTLGQLLLFGLLIRFIYGQTKIEGWLYKEQILLFTAIGALPSLLITLVLGTFSLLMLIALMGFSFALKRGREIEAIMWLILGSIKPQVMVLPGIALLFSRRWKILGIGTAIMSCIIFTSSLALKWDIWVDFFGAVAKAYEAKNNSLCVNPEAMCNLRGTLSVLLGPQHIEFVNMMGSFSFWIACITTAVIWNRLGREDAIFDLLMALTVILGMFFGLHVNPHDGLFMVVPALLFYNYLRQGYRYLRIYAVFALSCPFVFLVYLFLLKNAFSIQAPVVAMVILGLWVGSELVIWWRNSKLDI
jgi:hypothetical protein